MSTPVPAVRGARDLSGSLLGGRYELQAVVGEGTFGHVYRGVDRRLDRTVAIKLIKPWWAHDPSWAQAFQREARLLARVTDRGVVQIFDVGQAPEGLYYVAEFVDGESLAGRLRRRSVDPWEACDIAEQLCRALGRAHSERVVHRDIKPANVLLSSDGEVKLGDFGVARLAEEGSDWSSSAMIAGTPKYMAPEHARGLRTSPASDVYSVGVVMYEMLAGIPPFTGTAAVELALSHMQDDPPPLPADTPPALACVVMRALAKDPDDRFPDGHAMAAALAHARKVAEAGRRTARTLVYRSPDPDPGGQPSGHPDATWREERSPRRNFNPAGRRRTIATFGVVLAVFAAMAVGATLLPGSGRVRVPQLRGLPKAVIAAKMRKLGLHVRFTSRHDAATRGTAVAQSPGSGIRVEDGATVLVVLSGGPPPVELPRLVGQGSESAASILSSLGLTARITEVPAPGVRPGNVTAQSPAAGKYVQAHSGITLSVAETPSWRPVTSFAGTNAGQSVPFRIRGTQFRVVYRMGYVGTCTFLVFCDGPSADVLRISDGSTADSFGLGSGDNHSHVVKSGAGVYQIRIKPGMDTAGWSVQVEDYY